MKAQLCPPCPIVPVDKHTQPTGLSFSVPVPFTEYLLTRGRHQDHELGKARHANQWRRNDREEFLSVANINVTVRIGITASYISRLLFFLLRSLFLSVICDLEVKLSL
jgi:hypothetical protein